MEVQVAFEDVASALAADAETLIEILAELASADEDCDGDLVTALAEAHSGSMAHCAILPWLSRLIVALGKVETADAAADAVGLVS